ncbi:MAG: class I SAM-dependent methyltransferase [Acidobacteria bacterium]|nr:class I SAM-dependent methyltransferase [Acidobacteriota bacterium]MBS1809402.1 class I SAM-dependent methyltransferase [Acidobacteriota bacterium]
MSKEAPSYQKLRGGYYTPQAIAEFLARWAIQSPQTKVLEPSCGDGSILTAAIKELRAQGATKQQISELVKGVELDNEERAKALQRYAQFATLKNENPIHSGDFFAFCQQNLEPRGLFAGLKDSEYPLFDAVIGNPPFIRYQNFAEEHRRPAFEIMRRAGMSPNRLTNSWVPFIVASAFMLNEKGRLAMVVPAELLQVNYSAELRRFLSDYFNKISLITFRQLVFDGIQQEVVLLLAERNGGGQGGIRAIELGGIEDLASYAYNDFAKRELKPLDHSSEKWTQYFLSKKEIDFLRAVKKHPDLKLTGDVMEVDVGIVTGQNQFFVLNREQIVQNGLQDFTQRIVSRSGHLKGIVFSEHDYADNINSNLPSFLLDFPQVDLNELPPELKAYVRFGEEQAWHTGFKCRIRQRWYVVPSVWTPDAFMLRQVHAYPKLILNQARATCTDTIHRVRFRQSQEKKVVTAAFLNSLTFAFAEVVGRSYGGGVLELEPNEAEKLPLPLHLAVQLDADELHAQLIKQGIYTVLEITDQTLLSKGLGLSQREIKGLRQIWEKLRDRRINRKAVAKVKESRIKTSGGAMVVSRSL